jgi:pyruvate formate lyase activating enzyme
VFEKAKAEGFLCAFVSNGNATPEALDFLRPWIVAYKIDLKGFDDKRYRSLGGSLENVKRAIGMVYERGLWLEVVTLLVPGFNDAEAELHDLARFLAAISRDIPWHVTGFHQDYKMTTAANTVAAQLVRGAEIGAEEGLRFVYAGNAAGRVGRWECTWCPGCGEKLIDRLGYQILEYRMMQGGKCPRCGYSVPGLWPAETDVQSSRCLPSSGPRWPRPVALE